MVKLTLGDVRLAGMDMWAYMALSGEIKKPPTGWRENCPSCEYCGYLDCDFCPTWVGPSGCIDLWTGNRKRLREGLYRRWWSRRRRVPIEDRKHIQSAWRLFWKFARMDAYGPDSMWSDYTAQFCDLVAVMRERRMA